MPRDYGDPTFRAKLRAARLGKSLSPDTRAKLSAALTRHGHTTHRGETPEYKAYHEARQRCENPRRQNFKDYGGRGIRFLFSSFLQWFAELGPKPTPAHSVDRVDPDGHYAPGNVKWSTSSEQRRNQRRNHRRLQAA